MSKTIKDIRTGELDEAINGVYDRLAAEVNNGGVQYQIKILKLDGWTEEEILKAAEGGAK
ncbi:MAG: hypothetical protein ABFE07_28230 [Armatimonadia bacterium]